MATMFHVLAGLALLAAVAAWAVAVRGGLSALAHNRAAGQGGGFAGYVLLVMWPFAVQRRGTAAEADADAVRTGKAAVAFFVAVTLAIASIAVYSNLTFRQTHVAPSGTQPGAPAPSPSKS